MSDAHPSNPSNNKAEMGLRKIREDLFNPVDIGSIVVFRMMFGAILFWEVWRFFGHDWISSFYIERKFYFKYFGFGWIHPWPGDGMYIHFVAVGAFGLCVMSGFFYRITSWLLFFGITFWFLLDQTRYLNHLYLTALLAFLMAVIPAHRAKSLDARLRPKVQSDTVPAWCLWLLRASVGLVYFYSGIAKLNSDWLSGEPIRRWLANRSDYPLIGSWLDTELATWLFSYGGVYFDLAIAPALLWRQTRTLAFVACVFFHTTNKMMFDIGIFPILMLAATLIMFPPDWPRRVGLFFKTLPDDGTAESSAPVEISKPRRHLTEAFFITCVGIQILMPLRHFLYPGKVHWTEEGHRFAWHMKLRQKRGEAQFFATDPTTGKTWQINLRNYLSSAQRNRVARWPDMCLQFAHFLADELKKEGHKNIEIRAKVRASLNGRKYQYLIDPEVDLSKVPRNLWHADWIVPLEKSQIGIYPDS